MEFSDLPKAARRAAGRVTWTWTGGLQPYPIASRLWRLDSAEALRESAAVGEFTPDLHLWWSGQWRIFNLADRADRCRVYEIVLREGNPADIESVVDVVLLCEAWDDPVLPHALGEAWLPLITTRPALTPEQAAS